MKWLTALLVVANLAVAGILIAQPHLSSGPAVPALNVDRLSLRSATRVESSAATRHTEAGTSSTSQSVCVEWRGLTRAEFAAAREQLKNLAGDRVMSFAEVPLYTRRWVIFPPLPSPQSAAAKLSELAAAGVQDAFVVKDGPWRNAISLGLYANDEAAGRRLRELEGKGVLGTRVEALPRQGTEFYFVIRSEDPDALKNLSSIKQTYPNSQQSRVACPS